MPQSFSYTLLITWLLIAISCKTHFVQKSYEVENISVSEDTYALDSSVVQLYMPYKKMLEKDMNRVISYSEVEMRKAKPESYLTNFLADLLLVEGDKSAQKMGLDLVPSVSFFNYGGIRGIIPQGEITVGNVYELMPFENTMVFLELDGRQMQEFLNYIAAKGGDSMGGARFTISGKKATKVTIGGRTLVPENSYWLVTNDYVANGGDGLSVLKGSKKIINSGIKIRDAIISNLEGKQKNKIHIVGKLDGRMKYD